MSQQITVEVSEKVFNHAATLAAQKNSRLEAVLSDLLETAVVEKAVEDLSDAEVLALTEMFLPAEQQEKLSDLLEKNREGEITKPEKLELGKMMRIYEYGLLRKSQALRVAVERGLIEPLSF